MYVCLVSLLKSLWWVAWFFELGGVVQKWYLSIKEYEIRQVFWMALSREWEFSYYGWDWGFIPSLLVFFWWFFVSILFCNPGKKTKFNSSKNPKRPTIPKRNVVFHTPFFRGYVKLEGCTMRFYALSQIIKYPFLTNQNVPWFMSRFWVLFALHVEL